MKKAILLIPDLKLNEHSFGAHDKFNCATFSKLWCDNPGQIYNSVDTNLVDLFMDKSWDSGTHHKLVTKLSAQPEHDLHIVLNDRSAVLWREALPALHRALPNRDFILHVISTDPKLTAERYRGAHKSWQWRSVLPNHAKTRVNIDAITEGKGQYINAVPKILSEINRRPLEYPITLQRKPKKCTANYLVDDSNHETWGWQHRYLKPAYGFLQSTKELPDLHDVHIFSSNKYHDFWKSMNAKDEKIIDVENPVDLYTNLQRELWAQNIVNLLVVLADNTEDAKNAIIFRMLQQATNFIIIGFTESESGLLPYWQNKQSNENYLAAYANDSFKLENVRHKVRAIA